MAKASPRRRWPAVLLKLVVVLGLFAALGLAYLDAQVRTTLAERLWQAPAHVYARPLHLYPGLPLRRDALQRELKQLGYRPVNALRQPGEYAVAGGETVIWLRRFLFDDGNRPAQRIRVRFDGGRVAAIADDEGRPLDVARLEPLLLGNIVAGRGEARLLVQLGEVPEQLVETLLLVEDRGFYRHWGVSPRAVARALWTNLRAGHTVQGGSTLTQQLIKNVYLDSDRTLLRKATEAAMAMLAEWHYDKRTLLEAYLNEIYLGQEGPRAVHGFALASRHYFNRPLGELSPEQIATLVGMVKGPSQYDPWRHPERSRARRDLVLRLMAEHGVIGESTYRAARARPLGLAKNSASDGLYPAYLDLVRRQLQRDYDEADLRDRGLRIFTAFDPQVQRHAEQALTQTLERLDPKQSGLEGAMLVTDIVSGDVLAVVGGRRTRFAGFNRALDAVRPIGSLVKPAVVVAALEHDERYTLLSPIDDAPVRVAGPNGQVWQPANYDKRFHGPTPIYRVLAESYNAATAHLGMTLGLPAVLDALQRLGVGRALPAVPALTLGAAELSPFEVALVYQTIAADGLRTGLRSIRSITAANGMPLARYPQEPAQAFTPQTMHLLQYALREVMRTGTGSAAVKALPGFDVAGKTGTTDQLRDSWFAGFAGDYAAVVWMGRDDNRPAGLTGATGALQAWLAFMGEASHVPLTLEPEGGIDYVWVDEQTNALSREFCEGARHMPFIKGSQPTARSGCALDAAQPVRRAFQWFRDLF